MSVGCGEPTLSTSDIIHPPKQHWLQQPLQLKGGTLPPATHKEGNDTTWCVIAKQQQHFKETT